MSKIMAYPEIAFSLKEVYAPKDYISKISDNPEETLFVPGYPTIFDNMVSHMAHHLSQDLSKSSHKHDIYKISKPIKPIVTSFLPTLGTMHYRSNRNCSLLPIIHSTSPNKMVMKNKRVDGRRHSINSKAINKIENSCLKSSIEKILWHIEHRNHNIVSCKKSECNKIIPVKKLSHRILTNNRSFGRMDDVKPCIEDAPLILPKINSPMGKKCKMEAVDKCDEVCGWGRMESLSSLSSSFMATPS